MAKDSEREIGSLRRQIRDAESRRGEYLEHAAQAGRVEDFREEARQLRRAAGEAERIQALRKRIKDLGGRP